MTRIFLFLIILVIASACNKPNPNPELLDPIYSDIQAQENNINAEIAAEEAKLAQNEQSLETVTPQSGQIKFVQKRIWESKNRLDRLYQMKKYWIVRKDSRKIQARTEYMKAFNSGQTWPDPKEFAAYKAQQKLEMSSRVWNVQKRIDETKIVEKKTAK